MPRPHDPTGLRAHLNHEWFRNQSSGYVCCRRCTRALYRGEVPTCMAIQDGQAVAKADQSAKILFVRAAEQAMRSAAQSLSSRQN